MFTVAVLLGFIDKTLFQLCIIVKCKILKSIKFEKFFTLLVIFLLLAVVL